MYCSTLPRHCSIVCFVISLTIPAIPIQAKPVAESYRAAIEEVRGGERETAYANWWGFDPDDATEAIQQAVDSGAKKVVVPFVGRPWIIRPVTLRGDLELVFDPGVLVLAKKGEFLSGGDSLFAAYDTADITISGYGAVLRMRKADYQQPPYEKAEWRMGLRIMGCRNVRVEGLRIESSGGDGIYIGSSAKNRWCEDIEIRDCECHDHYRQGMSVISAQNLLVENCRFSGTEGTIPESGIDFEPDSEDERLVNCVVRNCVFESNAGSAILVYLRPLTAQSEPVSIRFENCHCRMGPPGLSPDDLSSPSLGGRAGMSVGMVRDDGPQGLVEFVNCTSENTGAEGARVVDKSADGVKVRFVQCTWSNCWVAAHRRFGGPRVPVLIHLRDPEITQRPGGIEFVDCHIFDDRSTHAVRFGQNESDYGLFDVTGTITVHSPQLFRPEFGAKTENVTLTVNKPEE